MGSRTLKRRSTARAASPLAADEARQKMNAELSRQMEQAVDSKAPIDVVVMLRDIRRDSGLSTDEGIDGYVRQILTRAEEGAGVNAQDLNILGNLGAVVVSAPPALVEELARQPEIESIVANQQPGDLLIRPRNKRVLESIDDVA